MSLPLFKTGAVIYSYKIGEKNGNNKYRYALVALPGNCNVDRGNGV